MNRKIEENFSVIAVRSPSRGAYSVPAGAFTLQLTRVVRLLPDRE